MIPAKPPETKSFPAAFYFFYNKSVIKEVIMLLYGCLYFW